MTDQNSENFTEQLKKTQYNVSPIPYHTHNGVDSPLLTGSPGIGSVTSVSVATANGISGTVATPTTTPIITLQLDKVILEETGAGTDKITIQAPASIAAPYTLTLPVDDGTASQVLTTNGSGVLSWETSSGSSLAVTDGVTTVSPTTTVNFTSNATVTDAGGGQADVAISGGSGSPGGNDTNIQFNNSGSFGGSDTLDFNGTDTVTFDNGNGANSFVTGGLSNLFLATADDATSAITTGAIVIQSGTASATDGIPQYINIVAGNSGGTGGFPFLGDGTNPGGDINLTAGNTGFSTGGKINISSGNARESTGVSGVITLLVGRGGGGGNGYIRLVQAAGGSGAVPNVLIGRPADTPSFGSGLGVVEIHNRSVVPTTNPTNGGLLYVESGALMYRGSSGTVTTVAPA